MGLLDRIGQGLVSFGSGIPQSEIESMRAEKDLLQSEARINKVRADQAEGANAAAIERRELMAAAAAGDPRAQASLIAQDPDEALKVAQARGFIDEQRRNEGLRFLDSLESTDDPVRQQQIIAERLAGLAGDPERTGVDTAELVGKSPEEIAQIIQPMRALLGAANRASASKLGAGVVVQNEDGTFAFANPVLTDGELVTQSAPIGGTPVSRIGETAADRQKRDIATAGGSAAAAAAAETEAIPEKVNVQGVAKRRQDNIEKAVIAADAVPTLARAINLLDSVETGGFEAAALIAKQRLGIESADEAELSNSMGKAVLSQLRSTFGAAFTAQEGESLKQIEANFGKSTEGNKRLLQQAKRLADRVIDRGIKSAIDNEDYEAAAQIKAARDFSLETDQDDAVQTAIDEL